jgi:NADH-quinone oxidoreductase subunit N
MFALAGLPPFAGFMAKLTLLTAALSKGYVALVVIAVINSAIAIYYYLCVVREACLREAGDQPPIATRWSTRALCLLLIAGVLLLGLAPAGILDRISSSLPGINLPLPKSAPAVVAEQALPPNVPEH